MPLKRRKLIKRTTRQKNNKLIENIIRAYDICKRRGFNKNISTVYESSLNLAGAHIYKRLSQLANREINFKNITSINLLVEIYFVNCFLYYELDCPIFTDQQHDSFCKKLTKRLNRVNPVENDLFGKKIVGGFLLENGTYHVPTTIIGIDYPAGIKNLVWAFCKAYAKYQNINNINVDKIEAIDAEVTDKINQLYKAEISGIEYDTEEKPLQKFVKDVLKGKKSNAPVRKRIKKKAGRRKNSGDHKDKIAKNAGTKVKAKRVNRKASKRRRQG